ncbi:MAG: hypothetical protein FJ319_05995 [SAR202 cluster bacterium]|nr:hypothetical protein [SAR202 cluster bacterium]
MTIVRTIARNTYNVIEIEGIILIGMLATIAVVLGSLYVFTDFFGNQETDLRGFVSSSRDDD